MTGPDNEQPQLEVRVIATESMGHEQFVYFDAGVRPYSSETEADKSGDASTAEGAFVARLSAKLRAGPGETLTLGLQLAQMQVFDLAGQTLARASDHA